MWECLEIDFGGFGDCSFLGDVFTGQNMTQPEWWVWKLFLGNVMSKSCGKQPDAWGCLLVQHCMLRDFSLKHAHVLQCQERAGISQNHTTSSPSLRLPEKPCLFFGRAILEISQTQMTQLDLSAEVLLFFAFGVHHPFLQLLALVHHQAVHDPPVGTCIWNWKGLAGWIAFQENGDT